MTYKTNLKRDTIIIVVLILFLTILAFMNYYFRNPQISLFNIMSQDSEELTEQEVFEEVAFIQEKIDSSTWKNYRSNWYGFEIKYPDSWEDPTNQTAPKNVKWEYRFQFRRPVSDIEKKYDGFDIVIYDIAKVKELSNTDEFPKIRNETLKIEAQCTNIDGHLIETGDYPAEEIYIPPTDDCYESSLFFSFIQDRYIYNIIPIFTSDVSIDNDSRMAINEDFPEFLEVVSTVALVDFTRPKMTAMPSKQKFSLPKPVSYKIGNAGRLMCAKKNDKPSKSIKNKKHHLDMECCLDPDETPNPWCYYPLDKYGKYLKK